MSDTPGFDSAQPERDQADWLDLLERACQETSQGKVAKKLGYTTSYIGQIRKPEKRAGLGDLSRVEAKVREHVGAEGVSCPVLGEISLSTCRHHRELPFSCSSPQRVRQWRACRDCQHNPEAGK